MHNEEMGRHKNSHQEDALIDFMQNHVDVARSFTRSDKIDIENLWKDLAVELNSLIPPIQDVNGWKKIWSCWKAAIKKKISINKKEVVATGGGPYNQMYISKKEETIGQICGLYAFVEGISNAKSAGDQSESSKSLASEEQLFDQENVNKNGASRKRKK